MPLIHVVQGDITSFPGDVVVNAANRRLRRGAGVCGALHHSAGGALASACRAHVRRHGRCSTGDVVLTTAGALRCRYVIHAVGPRWFFGFNAQAKDACLERAYNGALRRMQEQALSSIAFPCISTGLYGFPADRAAQIAVRTVLAFLRDGPGISVWFYCHKEQDTHRYNQLLSSVARALPHTPAPVRSWIPEEHG